MTAALTQASRIAGKAAMELSLTPVARARRRFKAGRPTRIKNVLVTPAEAMRRAVVEYAKLWDLTQEELEKQGGDFDPNDTRAGLVYVTPDEKAHTEWLPTSRDGLPAFVDKMNALTATVFLGVIFHQFDRLATKVEAKDTFWVLQFVAGPLAYQHLGGELDKARLARAIS
jgi:hypothetical protein